MRVEFPGWEWRVIELYEGGGRVEFVMDGVVCNAVKINAPISDEIIANGKLLLQTWIEEHLLPRAALRTAWSHLGACPIPQPVRAAVEAFIDEEEDKSFKTQYGASGA